MKISTMRGLLVALDVALCAGIGGVVFKEYEAKDARPADQRRFKEETTRQLKALDDAAPQPARKEDFLYLKGPLGSTKEPDVEPEAAPPPVERVDTTPLDGLIVVRGVWANADPSFVRIEPKDPKKVVDETGFFEVGQVVEFANGAAVKEIRKVEVLFDYQGQEVIMGIEPYEVAGAAEAAGRATGGTSGPRAERVTRAVLENPGSWVQYTKKSSKVTVTKTGVSAIRDYGDEVIKDVVWATDRLADGKKAIKITKIPTNSALRAGGLEEGDVIESINGERVTSKAEIVSYVKRNPNLPKYTVKIIRRGRTIVRTVVAQRR
jgi:type II secretory pathway component PulC